MDYLSPAELISTISQNTNYKKKAEDFIDLVANGLNSSSSHFLLELIQNADDNDYDDPYPTLTVTYTPNGHLRLHCNEKGFKNEHVAAICNINHSTKRESATTTGEKGIGFKSVFRVARAVWIASGAHRFKLRREKPFEPEIFKLPFPDQSGADSKGTYMYFEIAEEKACDVRESLERFQPANILFLKKLEQAIISIKDHSKRQMSRINKPMDNGPSRVTIIEDGGPQLHYIQFSFDVKLTVPRPPRRDNKKTCIKFAFPVTEDFQRLMLRNEKVYAYLPVKDYGFKFAFHADFVLVASREDIENSEWNRQLRGAIAEKFAETIEQLNKSDTSIRYTWPLLLTSPSNPGDFFYNLITDIKEELKSRSVLETQAGDLVSPKEAGLVRFPARWRLGRDKEIPIPSIDESVKHLSDKYDVDCTRIIGLMGVEEISDIRFWSGLKSFIGKDRLLRQSEDWHNKLAEMLNNDECFRKYCSDLKLIPVESGNTSWVCSDGNQSSLFIATRDYGVESLPQGIGLHIIPENATRNKERLELFKAYGAKYASDEIDSIAIKIKEKHLNFDPKSSDLTTEQLISHISFLFRHKSEKRPLDKVWVATESGVPKLASETFAKPLEFSGHQLEVPVLHRDYWAGLSMEEAKDLSTWMSVTFKMPELPRLATSDESPMSLSPEMRFIAQECDSFDFLDLLRQHWELSPQLLKKGGVSFQQNLWNDIVSTKIRYQDSKSIPLSETILRSEDTEKFQTDVQLPLLPIPKDNSADWGFLTNFGVKISLDVQHWLRCLTNMKSSSSANMEPSAEATGEKLDDLSYLVSYVYSKIWDACTKNSDIQRQVREKFQAQDLVFIPFQPSSSLHPELTWARPEQCIWFGPQELELKHTFTLARYAAYYPRRDFFLNVLQIKWRVDLSRLEYEAKQLSANADSLDTRHGLDYIGRLFQEMSGHVQIPSDEDKEYDALKRCPMLPIRFRNSARYIDQLIAATDDAEWFVADRELFLESFRTQVSLLALDIYQIKQCDRLFSFLNLDRRYLSQITEITESYSMTGKAYNAVYAAKWMKKAKYIDRLASEPIRQPILCPVPLREAKIEAFGSSPDSVQLMALGRRDKYYGTVKHRLAVAHLSGNVFRIYVSNDNLSSSRTLMELADDICDIYHIPAARRLLVPYIIDQEDMDEVENILETKKIPKLRNHRPKKLIKNESTVSAPVSRNEKTEGQTAAVQSDLEKKAPKISEEDYKDGPARSVQVPNTRESGQTNDLMMSALPSPPSSSSGTVGHSPAPSINAQELGGESLSEKFNQPSPSPSEVGSKPDTADGPHEKRTDGDTKNHDRQQSSHVSHTGADKGGKATAGTIPPQTAFQTSGDNETDNRTMISEGGAELPNRNATLSPRRQVSRSPSRTPLTRYIESANHKASYSPPSSTHSRTRSNKDNFVNFGNGWMTTPPPMTIFYGNDTNDTEYFGELYVSAYLENFLGKGVYKPKEHWTSPLRSRNALPSYTSKCSDTSTFTIKTRAKLRDAIICSGQVPSNALADCITVHIEVCTTNGDLNSHFFLRNCQYKKIEAYHLQDKTKNEHVYILARVYQVWENPGIAMYVDPWQLQLDASITLEATSSYLGHIVQSTPTVLAEKFASVSRADETSNIYDGLEVGPGKIRLLKLQHVEDDSEPLTGWLEVVEVDQLDELEDFWAISYHWGPTPVGPNPPTFTRKDGTMPATIQITESLSSCLKCLRRKGVNARIWADALCINQKDAKEKSIQVRRLGSLYDKAARVIVWLGHNGGMDETSREIEWLTEVHQSLCLPNGCCHTHQGPPATNPNAPDKNDPHWNEVSEFLKRPWFTRSWVIQELVLGGDVSIMSGRSEMKWDCFMESLLECGRHLNRGLDGDAKDGSLFLESSAAAIALHRTRQVYRHSKQKFHFLRLLEMFAYTDSSRARDKMFSLLNLAVDLYLSEEDFDPDYASTDEMVMEKYARGFVRNDHALDLLYHAGHDKSTSFCSWIPDFVGLRLGPPSSTNTRRTYPPTISTWKTRGGGGRFYAGLHGLSWAEVLDNSQGAAIHPAPILKMKGYVVDEIHECSELGLGRSDVVTFAKALYNMRRYVSYLKEYPEIDNKDASVDDHAGLGAGLGWQDKLLLRLLVGDSKGPQTGSSWTTQFSHSNADDDEEQVRPWPAETGPEMLSLNLDKDARILEEKPVEAQVRMAQYWQTAWTFTSRIPGAAFCTTRNPRARDRRYAGIVPGGAVSGDLIFVANGGRVPFVLRQVESTDYYTLIGECYIHGIMYGLPPGVQDKADVKVQII